MTVTLAETAPAHDHTWRLDTVEYDEVVGQVARYGCDCGSVWFR